VVILIPLLLFPPTTAVCIEASDERNESVVASVDSLMRLFNP